MTGIDLKAINSKSRKAIKAISKIPDKPIIGEEQYVTRKGLTRIVDLRKYGISWDKFIIFIIILSLILAALYFLRINTREPETITSNNRINNISPSITSSLDPDNKGLSPSAVNFKVKLGTVFKSNTGILINYIKTVIDPPSQSLDLNQKNEEAFKESLTSNSIDFKTILEDYFSSDFSSKLSLAIEENNTNIVTYAKSLKSDNTQQNIEILKVLEEWPESIAIVLGLGINGLDSERNTFVSYFRNYNQSFKDFAIFYKNADYTKAFTVQEKVSKITDQIANFFSDIIIKQFPDKFAQPE
jgi:hypothetical protein